MNDTGDTPQSKGQPGEPVGLGQAALFGLCPDCGSRTLFDGPVKFADRCAVCGLDISRFNVGDGPAAFLTLIIGAVVIALAIWLDVVASPPFWVHALIWIPFTIAAVIWGLRVSKAALLVAEHRNKAREAGSGDL